MITLGRLEEIKDFRTIWQDEDDFSAWLIKDENIQILAEAVGIKLKSAKINSHACIIASEPETDHKILIGSQLDETSNEFLGNIIISAAVNNANIIIWISKHANNKHKTAAEWLNSNDDIKIFICEMKLFTIGNESTAVKIDAIIKPVIKARENSEKIIDVEKLRFDFWGNFQDYAFGNDAKNKKFAGSYKRWKNSSHYGVVFGIGRPGCNIQVTRMPDEIEAGLYIADDKNLFASLIEHKDEIEAECGLNFSWFELSDGKACRISVKKFPAKLENKENWPEQFNWIIDTVLREKEIFSKFIRESNS